MSGVLEVDILPVPDLTRPLAGSTALESSGPAGGLALSDTFQLSSRPGANHTIYLDFDGHVTSGTIWNSNFNSSADIATPAYDTDGNASSFSDDELQTIQYIWARVAEDFIPFEVNVTTAAPASGDLVKSGSGDARWGVRVVIGGSSSDWFGSAAGGVAYVGSFNWSSDTPVYVFPVQLGNGNEKYTAEAISHEAGHAVGLSHDGTSSKDYYEGHGGGETGWAPIMGAAYYQNVTQFSKGEYSGANQKQDDLAIITTQNGFEYRVDDHGDTTGTAGTLTLAQSSVTGGGIIERTTDVDVLSFSTGAGAISLSVLPAARGPNLDILAELLNGSGAVIASSNPADLLGAVINTDVAAGMYYLRVSGVGKGDALGTGYTDYASLGQYTVSGTVVPAGAGLSISNVTVNERDGQAVFTVGLSQPSGTTVTVDVATAGGSAAAGEDFQSFSVRLSFNPGVTTQTVSVPIINNTAGEPTESFTVNLSNASGALIFDGQGVGTIVDDDVTVSISDASVTETNPAGNGAPKTTDLVFTLSLSAAATGPVTVQYATADGSALAGSDYTSVAGSVTFNPGETSKSIVVKVIGDKLAEPSETLILNLFNPTGASLGDTQGTGTIIDNDSGGGGGGGKSRSNRGAVAGGSDDDGAALAELLASLADTLARPNGAAVNAFQKSAAPVLTLKPAPLFIFSLFDADSTGGFHARELR